MIELEKPPPELKHRLLSAKQQKQRKTAFGAFAEQQAQQFLINQGYKLLDQNIRVGNCEVDIVALDVRSGEVVFVEVKARKNQQFGWGSQAVGRLKIAGLMKVARAYLSECQMSNNYRFDIICWCKGEIDHFQNVTWNF